MTIPVKKSLNLGTYLNIYQKHWTFLLNKYDYFGEKIDQFGSNMNIHQKNWKYLLKIHTNFGKKKKKLTNYGC